MKRCEKVIVVEGKYDKIRLESCLAATVVTTEGFGVFRDDDKKTLLRRLAETRGLVLLFDPDGAGQVIRRHLHTITGKKGIMDLYIPPIKGKEKRKSAPGKEGVLGVEGMENEMLLALFESAGLLQDGAKKQPLYTKYDLYRLGYAGTAGAEMKRRAFLAKNRLPQSLSANAFLDAVNLIGLSLERNEI